MSMVSESREALRTFERILHREASVIASLIGNSDELRPVVTDWVRTLKTRTDFLASLSTNDKSEPPAGFGYWPSTPLREALLKSSLLEATGVQILERLSIISEGLDELVDTMQADPNGSTMLRYVGYLASDIVEIKQGIQRHFPSLDDRDEKLEGK